MAGAATYLHGRCIEATVGAWQAVTYVPSTTRPTPKALRHTARKATGSDAAYGRRYGSRSARSALIL